jgi:sulfate permease, SulP family
MATLAAVLFVVAYNMGEWREIPDILRLDYTEILVWLITFGLTVVADLTLAVEVGMALAALLYIYKVSQTTNVSTVTGDYIERGRVHILQDKPVPDYVSIIRIQGPFLFGTTEKLIEETADVAKFAPIVVLRLRNMTAIDATGLHALEQLADRLKKSGRTLLLCGALPQPSQMLHRAEFVDHVGEDNILPHINAALERAAVIFSSLRQSA